MMVVMAVMATMLMMSSEVRCDDGRAAGERGQRASRRASREKRKKRGGKIDGRLYKKLADEFFTIYFYLLVVYVRLLFSKLKAGK